MLSEIEKIKKSIEPIRQDIIHHKVYSAIKNLDDLKIFMQYHVYAVWDFMSLLKSLQNSLTCTTIPWFVKGSAETRFLINEIVVGEESDINQYGQRTSHFELYIEAMKQCGADISGINTFIESLKNNHDFEAAFLNAKTPNPAKEFVNFTFSTIRSQKDYLQSAIFTFGREDLIPGMFISFINQLHQNFPESISTFKYYIERHIQIDGDNHSHLAMKMTSNLCGTEKEYWSEAEESVINALRLRVKLWDGAYEEIVKKTL